MFKADQATTYAKSGFTLMELIITIVILAILASIAIPHYLNYTRINYYNEVIKPVVSYKTGVAQCYQNTASFRACNGGSKDIPANITTATGAVASLTVTNGVITVVPVEGHGIVAADTYILTPTIVNNSIVWTASGGGVTAKYVK